MEVLTYDQLYRFAFPENNVERKWDRIIFTFESTFSSANDEPVLVYRPHGERYNRQYVYLQTQWTCVHCWAGIPMKWLEFALAEGHLNGLQYQHILQNVMVPSVRMLYPDGIIHLQQHHSIHDSHVVQECLSRQADIDIIDCPPRAPDMNPIENMWSEVKRTMQETWPVLPPINSDEL